MLAIVFFGLVIGSCVTAQGVIIYRLIKRVDKLTEFLDRHDVSIRRLNHRVIGEQRPIKGVHPEKLLP